MKKVIFINIGILLFIINSIYAQRNDTIVYYFPKEYFLDTINLFEQEKNEEFFKIREENAILKNYIYSEQLIKLNEPKLHKEYCYESYRFTWFGYFGTSHNPFSIRIENRNENVFLIAKYICRKKGLIVNDTVAVEKKEWKIFKNKLDSINFWNTSPIEKTNIFVMDGSIWILEGQNKSLYHMVHRNCGKEKEIGEICLFLLKLSKLKLNKRYFY